jgi:hypothetical protein
MHNRDDSNVLLNVEMWRAFFLLLGNSNKPNHEEKQMTIGDRLRQTGERFFINAPPDLSNRDVRKKNAYDAAEQESFDDEIGAGSAQGMTYQERYEFVKKRTYSKHKK